MSTLPSPMRMPIVPALAIAAVVAAGMVYANLSFAVSRPEDYRYFPPFQAGVNRNMNWELGHEYFNIARSLARGDGYANPFPGNTGPTAWMAPVLPFFLASLWWMCDGNRTAVLVIVLVVQALVLIATGWLTLAISRHSTQRIGPSAVAAAYCAALLVNFRDCFQANGDRWITLLALDLLVAGLWWGQALSTRTCAAGWGLFGGLCALTSPIAGFAWLLLSIGIGARERAWPRLALMLVTFALALAPWTVRNYLVFGRLIPVKSNLAYELYQSHCLQDDGILQAQTLGQHPYQRAGRERRAYDNLGEAVYLERKAEQFRDSVAADPVDLLDRIAARFLAATLWHAPIDRAPVGAAWWEWTLRIAHPLPFLALVTLVFFGICDRLPPAIWRVILMYAVYLGPYVITSYYERYAFPLLAAKVLLVVWAVDRLVGLRSPADGKALPKPTA